MNKFIYLIFFLTTVICSQPISAQQNWVKSNSPTLLNLWKICAIDSLLFWAAGDSGIIMHTSDGGNDWQIQSTGSTELIQDIFFLNQYLGWAVTTRFDSVFGSYILSTTDGGLTWDKKFFLVENVFFHTIYFWDSLNGWVAGGPSEAFYQTTDGGLTWQLAQLDGSLYSLMPVQDITFFSQEFGYACGGLHDLIGVIWKTTNGGENWVTQSLGPEPLRELEFIDSLHVIGVGGDFEYGTGIARTSDGGRNWIYEQPGFLGTATGVSFRKPNEPWACIPSERKFIFSIDNGENWNEVYTPGSVSINDLVYSDSLHGIAVGDSGTILKYKVSSPSAINDEINYSPQTYLFQNFPNPFNPTTVIRWELSKDTNVILSIYNCLGEEIETLVNEFQSKGEHQVTFNSNGLSSGIYYYRVVANDFTKSKAMLLLK